MRRLLIALALLACSSDAHAKICGDGKTVLLRGSHLDGHQLRLMNDGELSAYAMGYMDAITVGAIFGVSDACLDEIEKCTFRRTNVQMVAMIRKFLNENPDRWHEQSNTLLYGALLHRCLYPNAK